MKRPTAFLVGAILALAGPPAAAQKTPLFEAHSAGQGSGQMLIGFVKSADEPPGNTDPVFAGAGGKAQVVGLDQFGPICDSMK